LKHDYESGGTGGNRFATILLYMSDLGETDGGETVFPYGIPSNIPEEKRITKDEVRRKIGAINYLFVSTRKYKRISQAYGTSVH
jgi:hypothetical protein